MSLFAWLRYVRQRRLWLLFVAYLSGGVSIFLYSMLADPSPEPVLQKMQLHPAHNSPTHDLDSHLFDLLPKKLPLISVVIPTYNYGAIVKNAVASVVAQTYKNLEILVINDNSTDPVTIAALKEIEKSGDQRMKVLTKKNGGLSNTRNFGFRQAKGDYVLVLDHDDAIEARAIAILALKLLSSPDVAYVYPYQWFEGQMNLVWETQDFNAYDLMWSNHPSVCALLRKSAWQAVGGYSEGMHLGMEDWDFWSRLAHKGLYGAAVQIPVFRYVRHGKTMSTEKTIKSARQIKTQMINDKFPFYQPEYVQQLKRKWRPFVSLIIPFYNSVGYWQAALDSILNQSFEDFEIIIVDDGSNDPDSILLLEELERQYGKNATQQQQQQQQEPRREPVGMPLSATGKSAEIEIQIYRRPHVGVSSARNFGALHAKGEWLLFLDADDILHPTALEKFSLAALSLNDEEKKNVAFLYSAVVHFGTMFATAIDAWDKERMLSTNFLTVTNLIHRETYINAGGMDESYDRWEDYDFWLRLISLGKRGKLIPEGLFYYRRRAGSRTQKNDEIPVSEMMADLRKRNPLAYGDPLGAFLPQYRPLTAQQGRHTNDVNMLLDQFKEEYEKDLERSVPYERYRRHNTPCPFILKHWSSSQIHILYLIPFMIAGGSERVDLNILQGLQESGDFHITLVTEFEHANPWLAEFVEVADEIFFMSTLTDDIWGPSPVLILEYLLISRNIDIVFNRNTFMGYRLFYYLQDTYSEVRFVDMLHLYEPKEGAWERESAPYHHLLHRRFSISKDLVNYVEKTYNLSTNTFRIIYNGADLETFRDIPKGTLRAQLGISDEQQVVGYIGRFSKQKEPVTWVQSAQMIAEKNPQTVFVMFGDGELRGDIEKEIKNSPNLKGKVHLMGFATNVTRYVPDFDVHLLTSSFEGFPLAILEALALGIPTVSTDTGAIREFVNSENGALVSLGSPPRAYANAVLRILAETPEQRQERRETCLATAQLYDLHKMQKNYEDEFRALAAPLDKEKRLKQYCLRLTEYSLFELNNSRPLSPQHAAQQAKAALEKVREEAAEEASKKKQVTPLDNRPEWDIGVSLEAYSIYGGCVCPDPTANDTDAQNGYLISGKKCKVELHWKVRDDVEAIDKSYFVFTHIRDQGNTNIGFGDAIPYVNGKLYETNKWKKGEKLIDLHTIDVPADVKSGNYRMLAGFFIVEDGVFSNALIKETNDAEFMLCTITVT